MEVLNRLRVFLKRSKSFEGVDKSNEENQSVDSILKEGGYLAGYLSGTAVAIMQASGMMLGKLIPYVKRSDPRT